MTEKALAVGESISTVDFSVVILCFFGVFALYAAVNLRADCPLPVGVFAASRVAARRLRLRTRRMWRVARVACVWRGRFSLFCTPLSIVFSACVSSGVYAHTVRECHCYRVLVAVLSIWLFYLKM